MNGIADTGFLVALANRREAHHDWVLGLEPRFRMPFLTGEVIPLICSLE